MKESIHKKIKYYSGQYDRAVERWINTNLRGERESVIRLKERVTVLKEIAEMIKE